MQQSLPPSRSSDGSRIENRAFNERISSIYPNRPVPAGATMRKEDDGISAADAGPWRRAQLKQSEPVEPTSTTQPAIDDSDRENMTRRFGPGN
jgi:ribosomal protein L39E